MIFEKAAAYTRPVLIWLVGYGYDWKAPQTDLPSIRIPTDVSLSLSKTVSTADDRLQHSFLPA